MKQVLGCVVACCLGGIGPAYADWHSENDFPLDEVARRPVAIEAAPTADEHLVAIARAADVNIIADATPGEGVEAAGAVVPQAREGEPKAPTGTVPLETALSMLIRAQKLHIKRSGERTFLLWRPPQDSLGLARGIVAQVGAFRRDKPVLPVDEISAQLDAFLRRSRAEEYQKYLQPPQGAEGADAKGGAEGLDVKLSDLPLPLREQISLHLQAQLFSLEGSPETFFDEEMWKRGRLFVGRTDVWNSKAPVPYLMLFMPLADSSGFSTGVGRLGEPDATGRTR